MTDPQKSTPVDVEPAAPAQGKTTAPESANPPPTGAAPAMPQTPLAPPRMDPVRRWVLIFAAFCMVLLAWYMAADRYTPFTTQARVNAFVVPIAPQVAGEIVSVDVRTNQVVKKGDLLARICLLYTSRCV